MNPLLSLSILIVAGLSFLAVALWSDNKRKEREAFYRSEVLKKLAEGSGGSAALELFREQDRLAWRARRERMRAGGFVTTAVSVAFTIFLSVVTASNRPGAWTLGLIPLSAGLACLVYGYLLFPKVPASGESPRDE